MASAIQSIRGMHDLLPDDLEIWQFLEDHLKELVNGYGYREIRTPLIEQTALFKRSIGEVTDIVEKEMYSFEDRNGERLSLRPEGTASVVRAGIQHGLMGNQVHRLWYLGPMFRHERPQKGRYRQFHQWGIEAFGLEGPDVDAEQILMVARLWPRLGLTNIRLEINSLGTPEARQAYREELTRYFRDHADSLDADSQRRLETNPLRILDSKNPELAELIANAPSLLDHLDDESRTHFEGLKALLDEVGVRYTVNPRLVRGLDYYTKTVFEWISDNLGAQGTVCAGGRYDGLVSQLGGHATPAAGFAMGLERIIALIRDNGPALPVQTNDAYLIMVGEAAERVGWPLAEQVRDGVPNLRLMVNCGGGSLKNQLKKADRAGARVALILGEREVREETIALKHLRGSVEAEQETLPQSHLAERLRGLFGR